MGMRDRRDKRREKRETFGRGGDASRFQMRQKLVSIGDDYWIQNADGERVFRVDGKAMRVRNTLDLEDAHGTQLCRIQTRVLHIRDSMAIEDPDGERMALVHKALISPLRERWKVDLAGDREWKVQGNIVDHEYEIEDDEARSPRSRRSGSGPGTPTASRSRPARTGRCCWPSLSPSTPWPTPGGETPSLTRRHRHRRRRAGPRGARWRRSAGRW